MIGGDLPLKSSFPPVVDQHTRLVVLGSLPGEMSLARREYYGNPANQFWRLISAVMGRDLVPLPYPARLEALLGAGIGLWDVVATARRQGSGDAAIALERANPLTQFVAALPQLRALAFNGGKAAAIGRRELRGWISPVLIDLPSSSAAHCRQTFEQKLERWSALACHLA